MRTTLRMVGVAYLIRTALFAIPAAAETPGAMPGDATMTCAQIATELAPYMQQMMPSVTAMGTTAQEVVRRGQQHVEEETPAAIGLTAAATAAMSDPTGLSGKAVGQAEMIHQQEAWQRTMAEDQPLREKLNAQTGQVLAQGQQLKSNARLQRLMQLVNEKHCDGR